MNSFGILRNWAEYVSETRPVVHLVVIPEVKATGRSLFFSLLATGVGVMFPMDFKFKTDFKEMSLTCDGRPVTPIQRGKIEYVAPLQSYFKREYRYAYAGVYTYAAEAFQPGKCGQLALQVISAANPTTPESKLIDSKMVQQVWSDFEVYRQR